MKNYLRINPTSHTILYLNLDIKDLKFNNVEQKKELLQIDENFKILKITNFLFLVLFKSLTTKIKLTIVKNINSVNGRVKVKKNEL